ncbi:hypothetical protein AVEN_156893-1 [Araneus ventricosus]|uniref:Uncharacterized protein n=1 Tax=Araneus ventricosus TaxID=182803 RepID=A0A4Y2EME5_ARAVE|nr:hypothetical protein AVEN_156893-1 [Araneus ventricosus]
MAPGSERVPPEDPPCMALIVGHAVSKCSPAGVEAWRGYQLRCRPCHLTTVQNDKVRPNSLRVSSELHVDVPKLNFRHFNLNEFIIWPCA